MRELASKRVLITGGAGGIGLALGHGFAAEGCEIVLCDLPGQALEKALADLHGRGVRAQAVEMDVTKEDSIRAARGRIAEEIGPLDILVNNAGIGVGGRFLDVELAEHRRAFEVNFVGLVSVTHAFLPSLVARPESHLVQMASASALLGLPYGSSYASSKWGVLGFSESLRLEMKEEGHHHVHLTTVCPGFIDTHLLHEARAPSVMPRMAPDRLAKKIIRAVRKNRPLLLTPWLVRIGPTLRHVLGVRLFDGLSRRLGIMTSMKVYRE